MTNTRWYIGEGDDTIIVDGEISGYPNTTIGEEISFEFYIRGDLGSTGFGEEFGDYFGGVNYETAAERYNRLKEYLRYAGYATVSRTMGSAYFTEPLDFANTSVGSLLVPIRPHSDIQEARGVWGVITGGDDSTGIFGAIARVSLDVFVLAEYSEYDSETAVRNEFEATI